MARVCVPQSLEWYSATQSRQAPTSRLGARRAKSLLRSSRLPLLRAKADTPALHKRTLSLSDQSLEGGTANDLAARNSQIRKLQEEVVALTAEVKRLRDTHGAVLQRKVDRLLEEKEEVTAESAKLQRTVAEWQEKAERLKDELEDEKRTGSEREEEFKRALDALKIENSELAERDKASKEDVAKVSGILKSMKAINTELEAKISSISEEMEQANRDKYELSIRLQAFATEEQPSPESKDAEALSKAIKVHKDRITFLEKNGEIAKREISALQRRCAEIAADSEAVYASLNKQITDLAAAKARLETASQLQTTEIEWLKRKLHKAKSRLQEVKKTADTQRCAIRSLQTDAMQARTEANAQFARRHSKGRDLAALQSKIEAAMEALWQKETEVLRKEAMRLRLEEELRNVKALRT